MSSAAGIAVCVTGASGYVASWLVKVLLDRGYTVKATVRNLNDPRKTDHLRALDGAEERLHLFEANLTEEGSFDSTIDGCEGVFHTASPCFLKAADPQAELIKPAVEGTLDVLRSCRKVSSVRRVVLTSSLAAAVANHKYKGADVVVDETWFSDEAYCIEAELWYPLSKTMAEKAAWKFAHETGIDLVVLLPGLVVGPLLQPTLNLSSSFVLDIIKGKEVFPSYRFIDIRDLAHAHVAAFENPSASGRYCLAATVKSHAETRRILHEIYPALMSIVVAIGAEDSGYRVSKKRAEEGLGVCFTPLEVSLKDAVESLIEKNFLLV